MKLGIIREGKIPPDSRVPLTPDQCAFIQKKHLVQILVEPSPLRCFSDEEYRSCGVELARNLSDCDVLLGVKEVPAELLIPGKTYFFFSHTIKKQPHNRKLLQAILEKNIRLVDYEMLKDEKGSRLIAFGLFAGMVGAHNALWTWGGRTGQFHLPRMKEFRDYEAAKVFYQNRLALPPLKIVLTGTGRVAGGAVQVLRDMGAEQVSPEEFLSETHPFAVFTQLDSLHYVRRKDGSVFSKIHFYQHPEDFESAFAPFARSADIMVNGIFWDSRAPAFFTVEQMRQPDFKIQVIADVSCDIAPASSVPSTIRASTIAEPVYGFDPKTGRETKPFLPGSVDVMAVDNLPNEMPRDASAAFGRQFAANVLPELFKEKSLVLERATVAENGELGKHFQYLGDYVFQPAG